MTLDGEVVSQWGSERGSTVPGEFLACPHGIWVDSHGDVYVGRSASGCPDYRSLSDSG